MLYSFQGLESIIGTTSVLHKRIANKNDTDLNVLYLKVLCNFTHCSGEKDWSSMSKNLIEMCIHNFTYTLETNLNSDIMNLNILRVMTFLSILYIKMNNYFPFIFFYSCRH